VLIADRDAKRRLVLLATLRGDYEVDVVPAASDPVRHARSARPDVVLLVVLRYKSAGALRCARSLKTATLPPRVALLDPHGLVESPAAALLACGADGYLVGELPGVEGALGAFVGRVLAGAGPVEGSPPKRGLLSRFIG
jgi:DNA-binding NarL/FixJ family response regulator